MVVLSCVCRISGPWNQCGCDGGRAGYGASERAGVESLANLNGSGDEVPQGTSRRRQGTLQQDTTGGWE